MWPVFCDQKADNGIFRSQAKWFENRIVSRRSHQESHDTDRRGRPTQDVMQMDDSSGKLTPANSGNRGGPQTPEGKAQSRGNALRHGMTATTLLPQVLTNDLVGDSFERLRLEWRPQTPTQEHLVREMARHQAALQRTESIEEAALRRSAHGALGLDLDVLADLDPQDIALAGAGTADAIDRVSRYRRSHERAFLRSLAALRDLQSRTTSQSGEAVQRPPIPDAQPQFTSESQCEKYLLERRTRGELPCPSCADTAGCWIGSRKVWQCGNCRRQSSLRSGTVMAGSHLSLLIWFQAIATIIHDPAVATADLLAATGLTRAATARSLAKRIRQALEADDRTTQLAGLGQVFLLGGTG